MSAKKENGKRQKSGDTGVASGEGEKAVVVGATAADAASATNAKATATADTTGAKAAAKDKPASAGTPSDLALDPARLSPKDEAIVARAAEVFLARGITDVKMTEIADAAQVGVATLYRRFSTKIDLAILSATMLWRRLNDDIRTLVGTHDYLALNGFERLDCLLCSYRDTYLKRADFMCFLDELDHVIVSEHVEAARLAAYGAEVDSFYPMFYDAYRLGLEDGSITCMVDFPTFYRALAHALTSTAQKLSRGEVIPSDDFANVRTELNYLIFMAKCTLTASHL